MSIKSEKIEILPCTSSPNVFDKSMINRKIEVDVELWSDHYIVVSYFVGDHEFHGILLKAQKNVHSPFDVDSKKFDEWKSLVSNNFQNWDSDKMSSLCLRQTCFDESKFDSFKIRQSHGIRRLDSRPVRLRPVASQRSTVLCARCQQQRVAIVPSRNNQYNNSPNNHAANKRSKQENFSNAINSETKKRLKAKKANAQLIFERLFTKKQEDSKLQQMTTVNLQQIVVAGQQPQPQQPQPPQPPPPPPSAPPRVPTLKITFGKSDAKTVTVINGRPPASSTSTTVSSSRSHHSNQEDKPAVKMDPVESAAASASSSVVQNGLHGGHLPIGMNVGDIVWAKMPSYPYWPAKIFDVYETHACVTWCGSTQYGYVDVSVLEPFVKCFNKRYNAKRTSGSYQKAVADAVRQFREIAENAYYVSLLSPACRKYVQKLKNRAETEKKHVKSVDSAKKSSARQNNVRSTDSDEVRQEIKSTLQPMPPLALAVKRSIPKTSPVIAMSLEMPPLKRATKETTPVARASPETPPVMEVDSEPESPDASPRLVIDELVEESFENFARRSRLSADFDDPVQQSDTTPSASPQGTSSSSTVAPMTSNGQGNEMDFDSVLSELQEMNDMCAAGSNSLLTSC